MKNKKFTVLSFQREKKVGKEKADNAATLLRHQRERGPLWWRQSARPTFGVAAIYLPFLCLLSFPAEKKVR